jgi:hypothetical protein
VLSPITQSLFMQFFPSVPSDMWCFRFTASPMYPGPNSYLLRDHGVIPTTVLSTVRAFQEAQCHAAVIRTGVSGVCTLRSASSKSDVFFLFLQGQLIGATQRADIGTIHEPNLYTTMSKLRAVIYTYTPQPVRNNQCPPCFSFMEVG